MKNRVELLNEAPRRKKLFNPGLKLTREIAGKVFEFLEQSGQYITVILTDDDGIKRINRDYRHKDSPTDVLSFAYNENPFPSADLPFSSAGDIIISLETLEKQSDEYGVSPLSEYSRLLVHGILHLYGFDHEVSRSGRLRMEKAEREIMESLHARPDKQS